jgi:hypothetical protein
MMMNARCQLYGAVVSSSIYSMLFVECVCIIIHGIEGCTAL